VAFFAATVTACSYLELVTKYPRAAGAALYTHKAFGIHFITFMIAFAVMCSGITSASTASRAFAANLSAALGLSIAGGVGITFLAMAFMGLVAAVNFRGVGESVKLNVVLTVVELTGLLIIISIGLWAIGGGQGDLARVTQFASAEGQGVFTAITAATALAFFAMVGFEDAVNMAEECKEPVRIFPWVMLTGLCITGAIYVLVSISAVALVPVEQLGEGGTPLLQVVEAGAPGFPLGVFAIITMFAVANSALINMLMASFDGIGEPLAEIVGRAQGERIVEGIAQVELDRPVGELDRPLDLPHERQIADRKRKNVRRTRVECQCPVVSGRALAVSALIEQRIAEQHVGFGVLRVERQGAAGISLLSLDPLRPRHPEVGQENGDPALRDVGAGKLRIEGDRPVEQLAGAILA